jgi:hypothetical protein
MILYLILSIILAFVINSNTHIISLNLGFNYNSLKNLISFLFMILLSYLFIKNLPELISDLFTELLIPLLKKNKGKIKEKCSTSKGKFEFSLGIVGTLFIFYNISPGIFESSESLIMKIIPTIIIILITYNIFSNLLVLFTVLFLILTMTIAMNLLEFGSTKEVLIKALLIFPFAFGLSIFFSGKFEKAINYIFGIKSTKKVKKT